jgi:hypothetical protein
MRHSLIVVAAACVLASTAQAQAATPAKADSAKVRRTAITLNPFALFATYFAGDIETVMTPRVTIGVGGSYTGIKDYNEYFALEAKIRYYPQEKALQGFSVAGTVGMSSARDDLVVYDGFGGVTYNPARTTRPTLGTELSYQWILGPSRRFVSVAGIGVKRLLGKEGNVDPVNIPILPTARINIGIAF